MDSDTTYAKVNNPTSTRTILADSDSTWVRVPFLVSFGKQFTKVIDAVKYIADDSSIGESEATSYWALDYGNYKKLSGNTLSKSGYTDTRIGANDALNCIWQFNRDDDIVYPINQTGGDNISRLGLGRVYAETTNKNQTVAYFTFGVPVFSNIKEFYTRAFDSDMIMYNLNGGFGLTEQISSLFNNAMSVLGSAAVIAITLPFLPFKWIGDFLTRSKNYRIDRFYDLRTTMHSYYRYVDSILNQWAIAVGLWGDEHTILSTDCRPLSMRLTGSSIFEIMSLRAAIMSSSRQSYAHGDVSAYEQALADFSMMDPDIYDGIERPTDTGNSNKTETVKFPDSLGYAEDAAKESEKKSSRAANAAEGSPSLRSTNEKNIGAWNNNRVDFSTALLDNAAGATQFLGFRINKSVDASESFSNSTGPSPLAEMFNNKVKQNMGSVSNEVQQAGTGFVPFDALVGGAKKIITGMTEFFGVGGLAEAVIGNTFIDVPESYRGSEYSKSHSISLQLRSPYGDVVSIYQTIIVPLACILAAAIPRAGGPYSYQSPFLCRVYVKGMFAIPLGIIDSLSIKRGSSEFGWTYMNLPTCIDVNLSIKDLSPLIYMAMTDKTFPDIFGANTSFKEYLLTLAGVGLQERISRFADIKRNTKLAVLNLKRFGNPAYWSSSLGDTTFMTAVGTVTSFVFNNSLTPKN